MKRLQLLTLQLLLVLFSYAGNEKNIVPSTLRSALIYRAGAELTHTAKASLEKGNNDLIIEGISNSVDVNSLQLGVNGNVTVLSVEFTTNYLKSGIKSSVVKKLEDSMETINKSLLMLQVSLNTNKDLLGLLSANREIKGAQTGLSVAELSKMMEYYKTKSIELQKEISTAEQQQNKLKEALAKLKNQLQEEETKNAKTTGSVILQLFSQASGSYDFTVSYITQAAYWHPYYDLRIESINQPIELHYRAKMVQSTGLDWKQVKLSLSTATPSQQGNAPVLKSWSLGYVNPVARMNNNLSNTLSGRAPGVLQLDEVVVAGYNKKKADDYVTVNDNTLNVVFDIDLPYDVPGNGKQQNVLLKEYKIPASYKFYAVPKLDKDAYLLGQAVDWEKLNLLPGEANIIFEGTYVGKSMIDPNSTLDTLSLTLGRDKRVIVKREKMVDFSSVKFIGANKKQVFTYDITVRNNKKEKISLLLKDQYPLSSNNDIEVELLESSGAEINSELGILNWHLNLLAGESKKVRISYSIKYPKDKMVNVN